jgi:hypothetical protein
VLREALNYPPSGKHGSRAVFVGGLFFVVLTVVGVASWYLLAGDPPVALVPVGVVTLWLFSEKISVALVVVVIFFLSIHIVFRGYYVAVLRASTGVTDPVAPPFRSVQLVIDGIKSAAILIAYFVPSVVLGGFGLFIRQLSGSGSVGTVINTIGAFTFLIGLFAFIAGAYLVPAATTLFARRNSLRAAFEFSTVYACIFTEDYAVGWLLSTLMLIVFTPIVILLQLVFVGFFLRFYLRVSVQHVYASAVTSALDLADDVNEQKLRPSGRSLSDTKNTQTTGYCSD